MSELARHDWFPDEPVVLTGTVTQRNTVICIDLLAWTHFIFTASSIYAIVARLVPLKSLVIFVSWFNNPGSVLFNPLFVGFALFVDYIKLYPYIYIFFARASRGLYRDGSSLLRAPSGTEHSMGNNLDLLKMPPKNNNIFNMVGLPILTVVLVSKQQPKRRWLDSQHSESIMWLGNS